MVSEHNHLHVVCPFIPDYQQDKKLTIRKAEEKFSGPMACCPNPGHAWTNNPCK
jgi:hypothetical protein